MNNQRQDPADSEDAREMESKLRDLRAQYDALKAEQHPSLTVARAEMAAPPHETVVALLRAEREALRARVTELEREREGLLMGGVTVEARQQLERAEKAEARVAELEVQLADVKAAHEEDLRAARKHAREALNLRVEREALRGRVAELEAQAKEHQDRQALWDEDASFYLQTLRQADRIGELEAAHVESQTNGAQEALARKKAEAERDEAVAALRGAKRWAETDDDSIVEFGEYKRNMEKVDAVLAKYPEGR